MNKDITGWLENCNKCNMNSWTKYYPVITSDLPEEPWTVVGTDLFKYKGKDFLLVDNFLRWKFIRTLQKL